LFLSRKLRKWIASVIVLTMPFALLLARSIPNVYSAISGVIWVLLPAHAIVGAVMLARRSGFRDTTKEDS